MSPINKKASVFLPYYMLIVLIVITAVIIAKFNWLISLFSLILIIIPLYLIEKKDKERQEELDQYITSLSYRLKRVGEEALLQMPIGIMLINEDNYIEWANPYIATCFNENTLVGKSLYEIADPLIETIKQQLEVNTVLIGERNFKIFYKKEEKLLYFFDITEQTEIEKRYELEKPIVSIIYLDNYDEITQGMDDQARSSLNSLVTSILNNWAKEENVYLKRTSLDRFIAFYNENTLGSLENKKFNLLDEVRELVSQQNVPLTLSIGVGRGTTSLPDLGKLAQSSLDLALGRGGDQVVIKDFNGKVKFYGEKTNPVEKRTRVRARVISQALQQLIKESDKVVVMGHKQPDMDSIGSAIGIKRMAEVNGRDSYIVLKRDSIDTSIIRLMKEIEKNDQLNDQLISPEAALNIASPDSLLVIVDTHKPSLVIDEQLIEKFERIVIIDHHRRSEDFIENPLLVYMEPYASSTAELITELLEYQPKGGQLTSLEATLLLAGIIVDTKSFTLRTGSRTFDAASYLRSRGADTVFVQKLLKEDLTTYINRAKIIKTVYFYKSGIAIAKAHDDKHYSHVFIAQAADTLLTIDEINASFVISNREDGKIGISARSLGTVNVQLIMEDLGGGGHLTNAATQLADVTIVEAEQMLQEVIDKHVEGSNE